ncbi:hypothetical protein [Rhodanobacter sp. MP1X3]|uniref:hypothetical protein n=1 Tax=Rhodanobacter sp. MP1X3 TaxID=2723086 RepID=UPI00161596FA|nr:hypothetical protein [Rhodanobacter sp. MP1X3]MBB6243094.1 hypothetical protein [Rhodanobacter sp. MP1X3]
MSGAGGWRPHIESALSLNVGSLFKAGALHAGAMTSGSWQWSRDGEQVASIGYCATLSAESGELRLSYTWKPDGEPQDVTCTIRLSSLPLEYGGRRWYMHCPYTQRRVLKLYKFGSIKQFCSRTAIRPLPTYASQRVGGTDRIFAQRWALRRRMGDDFSDLFGEPFKPKGMHWSAFRRYADRDAELERREGGYLQRLLNRMQKYG